MFLREKMRIRLVLSVLVIHNSNTLYYCLILLWAAAVAAIKDLLLHKFRFFSFSLAFLRFSESVFNQTNGCWIFQFCQKYNQFIYLLLCIFFNLYIQYIFDFLHILTFEHSNDNAFNSIFHCTVLAQYSARIFKYFSHHPLRIDQANYMEFSPRFAIFTPGFFNISNGFGRG